MILNSGSIQLRHILILATAWTLSGCSGISESVSGSSQASADSTLSTTTVVTAGSDVVITEEIGSVSGEVPGAGDNESITVRSPAQRVESNWGGTNYFAKWVGDEFWTASSESPEQTEDALAVTSSDLSGEAEVVGSIQE